MDCETIARSGALVARIEAAQARVDAYVAQVETFFAACTRELEHPHGPLEDLRVIQELNELEGRADATLAGVEEVICTASAAITGRLAQFRDRSEAIMIESGTQVAVAAAHTGDADRDFAIIDETIDRFVSRSTELPAPPDIATLLADVRVSA